MNNDIHGVYTVLGFQKHCVTFVSFDTLCVHFVQCYSQGNCLGGRSTVWEIAGARLG